MALEIGRICLKTAGRESGKYCCVVDKIDDNYVLVTGPKVVTKVKRRRCNVEHLEPTPELVKIKPKASDQEVLKAYDNADLYKKLKIEKPSAEKIKAIKEMKVVKEVKKKEKIEKPKKEVKEKVKEIKEKPEVKKPKKAKAVKKPKKEKKVKKDKKKKKLRKQKGKR